MQIKLRGEPSSPTPALRYGAHEQLIEEGGRAARSRLERTWHSAVMTLVVTMIAFGASIATASAAENVLKQGWENPTNGLTSDKPTTGCGGSCEWTRTPVEGSPASTADAAKHNFWHVEANPQNNLIKVPDINPNLVQLAPGDNGHLPSAFEGTHAAWFGEPSTGTFCGADFKEFGEAENLTASLNGCKSSEVESGTLTSPPFSLIGASSAILHFFSWWEIESVNADAFDLMGVEYSTDSGTSWTTAGLLNPANNPAGNHYQPYSNTGLQSPPQWKEYLVDLTPAIGFGKVEVRFNFNTNDPLYNGFRGWLIDSVRVATPSDVADPAITGVDTCSGTTVAPVTVIHGTNFLLASKVSVDGGEAQTAQTPSSDRIEIPAITAGPHTIQVIDPNGTIKSNVLSVTQPANCSPALPPPPPVVNNQPPPPPDDNFTDAGNPAVEADGLLVFNEQFPEAGDAVASADVSQGAEISRVRSRLLAFDAKKSKKKSKKCKRGFVRKGNRCVSNTPVVYGTTSLHIPGAGVYRIAITPSAKILAALKKGKTLHVQVAITFHSTRGGAPVTKLYSVTVKGKKHKAKKKRHKKKH